jgi:hypothetical protein
LKKKIFFLFSLLFVSQYSYFIKFFLFNKVTNDKVLKFNVKREFIHNIEQRYYNVHFSELFLLSESDYILIDYPTFTEFLEDISGMVIYIFIHRVI